MKTTSGIQGAVPYRAVLCAFTMALTLAGTALAGPLEDAMAAYEGGDYATVLQLIYPLAIKGDATAQYNLGVMYYEGKGVRQDYAAASQWYRLAADQGYALAQSNLGVLYVKGQGVPQDYAEMIKWYYRAADQGVAVAQYNLGVTYYEGKGVRQDFVQAHKWFNLAASRLSASEKERMDEAIRRRDYVAIKMTPAQVAEAQQLARDWHPK